MKNFSYKAPDSLANAAEILTDSDNTMLIAGGMSLIADMKAGKSAPEQVVDLSKVEGLKGIKQQGECISIGAMTSYAEIAADPLIVQKLTAFANMSADIGDPAVRTRATIGGALAVNDPSSDYPAAILALDAVIVTNNREIPAEQFFVGPFKTALTSDEIILEVTLQIPERTAYCALRAQALRLPVCGVFIASLSDGMRATVTGLSTSGVFRWHELEQFLLKSKDCSSIVDIELAEFSDFLDTIHASARYRRHLAGVMAKRAAAEL